MEKAIIGLHQEIDGKTYHTYHVVPAFIYKRIKAEVMEKTINAFPTREEAEALLSSQSPTVDL